MQRLPDEVQRQYHGMVYHMEDFKHFEQDWRKGVDKIYMGQPTQNNTQYTEKQTRPRPEKGIATAERKWRQHVWRCNKLRHKIVDCKWNNWGREVEIIDGVVYRWDPGTVAQASMVSIESHQNSFSPFVTSSVRSDADSATPGNTMDETESADPGFNAEQIKAIYISLLPRQHVEYFLNVSTSTCLFAPCSCWFISLYNWWHKRGGYATTKKNKAEIETATQRWDRE